MSSGCGCQCGCQCGCGCGNNNNSNNAGGRSRNCQQKLREAEKALRLIEKIADQALSDIDDCDCCRRHFDNDEFGRNFDNDEFKSGCNN